MTEPIKQTERDDRMSSEDYEHLLDRYAYSTKEITMGKVLKGRVIKCTPTHVLVDVGFKTEGLIPNEEFTDPRALEALQPGSEIETMLEPALAEVIETSRDDEHTYTLTGKGRREP